MGESYLVNGAKLWCMCGSESCDLQLLNHGYIANGRYKANSKDRLPFYNISGFGICKAGEEEKECKSYMLFEDEWTNTGSSTVSIIEQMNDQDALTLNSVLLCKRGGVIVPETSGQGDVQEINWEDYKERYGAYVAFMGMANYYLQAFDPINLNTGNFIYEKEDLMIGGISKLFFHMVYYSAGKNQGGSIGEGWHHNYEIFVEKKDAGILCLHLGDGQNILCKQTIGDIYMLDGTTGFLKRNADGYCYVSGRNVEYLFDKDGRIIERKNGNGNTDTFSYNKAGQLIEVHGANGGVLYYDYNREGNLYRVSDHTGRQIQLCYSYRVLRKFINSSGQEYIYQYNENMCLESVITPRGITGVKNVYDSANRVIKQITPDGGIVGLRYDDQNKCTYAKNQNGYITSCESDNRFRNIRTIYQDSEERFEYNEKNQRISYVDRNGNIIRYFYDEQGRLSGIVNALGVRSDFSYNKNGRLVSLKIDDKDVLENEYDQSGHLIKTMDALGRIRRTIYGTNGLPERIIMPDGSDIQIAYDERGNVQKITNAYGVATEYRYDELNRLIQITDGEGSKVSYQYDERNHLLSETNPEGCVRKYTYDVSGRPTQIQDFDGGIVGFSYNAMGRPEVMIDKEGRKTKRKYNLSGKVEKEVSPSGRTTIYQYDRDERLIRIKYLMSEQEEESIRMTDFVYDSVGNLLHVKDGDGREIISETMYEYDALNRVTAMIDSVGGRITYTYDKRSGKVSSVTDEAGNLRTFQYNAVGELIEETDAGGNTTCYQYNELGKIMAITDAIGRVTKHYYLPGGRLKKSIYPDGREMLYEYDALGRIHQKTDGKGYSLSYEYDSMGRILRMVSSAGQETSYTYDATGNVTTITDAGGNITKYAYTLSGKIKEVTDAFGNSTEYSYDLEDNLTYIRQHGTQGEEDRVTEYERDVFGKITCVRSASGEEHYRYDMLGRMIEKTDREGGVTAYTYTADGMAESILYSDGRKAEFVYSPLKQLILVRDWLGETKIDRDKQGRPVDITDYKGRNIHYEWGNLGERRKLIYPDGTVLKWQYDEMLRPVELAKTAGGGEMFRINYRYDGQGRLSERKSSGGYHTCWHYNEMGQLDELIHEEQDGILDRMCYVYDVLGNKAVVTKERRGVPTESGEYRYTYDALHRLIGVEKDGRKLRYYRYDSFGNRTCMEDYTEDMRYVYTYDNMNQMIEKTASAISKFGETGLHMTYTYDGRGNLTGEYCDGRLRHGYTYNTANKLEKSWDDKGREADYIYNALGQRTGKCCGEKTEEYLLDLTKSYNNLIGIKEQDGMKKFFWDANVAVMEDKWQKLHYYMQDELGSPLRVLYGNGNGDIYGYDEFGREISCQGNYGRQGEKQPFGYIGYRYDAISQTYFAQAREYQPEFGRFMAEDIKSGNRTVPKTRNRYGYCWNNPLGMVDLDGKEPEVPKLNSGFFGTAPSEQTSEISQPMEILEEIKRRDSLPEVIWVKKCANLIESSIAAMSEDDYGDGITAEIRKATSDWNGVLLINTTGNIGMGGYVFAGRQYAIDWHGNVVVFFVDGTGVETSESAKLNVAVGYLNVPLAEQVAGLGTETGVSAGNGLIAGLSWITANEDDGKYIASGFMADLGLGEQSGVLGVHESLSHAREIYKWNIFNAIDKIWFFLGDIFNGNKNEEMCKN